MKKTLFLGLLMGLIIGILVGCGTSIQKPASAAEQEKQHILSVEDVISLPAPPGWNRSGAAAFVINYKPAPAIGGVFILAITEEGVALQQVK